MRTDEGIEISKMSFNVFIAVGILAAASLVATLGYTLWNLFSQEETQNKLNANYAQYAAFDDETVLGQDIINSYLTSKGEVPIIFIKNSGDIDPDIVWGPALADAGLMDYVYKSYERTPTGNVRSTVAQGVQAANYSVPSSYTVVPYSTATQDLTVACQTAIKGYRHTLNNSLSANALYGTWHSRLVFSDTDCTQPSAIIVYPLT